MAETGQRGAGGKPKPGLAAVRARALVMLASGEPAERIAAATGQTVKNIQNLASEHAEALREAAAAKVAGVVEATIDASAEALAKIREAAPKAADKLVELMRDGGDKESAPGNAVELRAALAILDRGGVPAVSKNEHTGKDGGPIEATVVRFPVNALGDGERR